MLRKTLSLVISFAFVITSTITPAMASPMGVSVSPVESALVKQLTPPASLGSIVDANITAETPLVIHIQDLHANYSVQSNIVKLLEFLDGRLGAGNYKVGIEGAQGPIGITELGKISDKGFKADVCDTLMKEAELTGTQYFSIVNGKTDLLWGVEDQRYHNANINLFQSTYKGKKQLAQSLSQLRKEFLPIKDKFYSKAMHKLDKKAGAYAAGKIDTADYTALLVRQASQQGISVADRYPEIAKWTGLAPAEHYADFDKLMTEQTALLNEVQSGLAKTEAQRNISTMDRELDILSRMLVEEITTEEVRQLAPQISSVASRIQFLLDTAHVRYDKKNLADVISTSLDFYAVALLRDQFLAENSLKLVQDPQSKIKNVVLVAGGFHTPGITKAFKASGVSYITIAPTVTSHTDKEKQLYVARLMEQHPDLDALLVSSRMLMPRTEGGMLRNGIRFAWISTVKRFGPERANALWASINRRLRQLAEIPIVNRFVTEDDGSVQIGGGGPDGSDRRARLNQIAREIAPANGGVLAADESEPTAGKRLTSVGLDNTAENRQRMRQMMLTHPGLNASGISATILYAETLDNVDSEGRNLVKYHLVDRGILAGLKTDSGLMDDPDSAGEKLPKPGSIENLPKLLDRAKAAGVVFTKWRTTLRAKNPTEANIRKNAMVQAQQARMTQDAGLVPMVEPEVIFDGSDGSAADHSLADSYATTTRVLAASFEELTKAGVWLDGMILKTSMILAGKKAPEQTAPDTVGFETLKGLLKTVPAEVPAIVFLSGGQSDSQATENLDGVIRASQTRFIEARNAAVAELRREGDQVRAIRVASYTQVPWEISYSFGRGLQARALATWDGKDEQFDKGQQEMMATAREVRSARRGQLKAFKQEAAARARLRQIAQNMAPRSGGVLAADESEPTAGKRLTSVGLENTAENRQRMRQMMLTHPGLNDSGISAVILYAETLDNVDNDGRNIVQHDLLGRGILPGLKTDSGLADDPDSAGEKIPKSDSIEKLPKLLDKAKAAGVVFTKWRTTLRAKNPTLQNILKNADVQAKQARMTQDAGLVPMVEPEVVYDGSDGSAADHSLADSYATTTLTLEATFDRLKRAGVWLDGMVLKTSMILAGKKAPQQTDPDTVGFETLKGLLKTVPAEVPAIVFLSGGQADSQATENLDGVIRASQTRFMEARNAAVAELNDEGNPNRAEEVAALTQTPWEISYSFGRGLQARALTAWGGKDEQFDKGQQEMMATAREVRSARQGWLKAFRAGESEPKANLALRSVLQLLVGILGLLLGHAIIGGVLAVWGLSKAYTGYRISGSFTVPAAVHTNAKGAHPLLMAEEVLHNTRIGRSEFVANSLDAPLFMAGLVLMIARALMNMFRPASVRINNSLYSALATVARIPKETVVISNKMTTAAKEAFQNSGFSNKEEEEIEKRGRLAILGAA